MAESYTSQEDTSRDFVNNVYVTGTIMTNNLTTNARLILPPITDSAELEQAVSVAVASPVVGPAVSAQPTSDNTITSVVMGGPVTALPTPTSMTSAIETSSVPDSADVISSTATFTTSVANEPSSTVSMQSTTQTCDHMLSQNQKLQPSCQNVVESDEKKQKLKSGTIAGIVVVIIFALLAIGILAACLWKARRKRNGKGHRKDSHRYNSKKETQQDFDSRGGAANDFSETNDPAHRSRKKHRTFRNDNNAVDFSHQNRIFTTEDVIRDSHDRQALSKYSNTKGTDDPFYTPFDSPEISESQIGIALTRYSTHASKKSITTSIKSRRSVPSIPDQLQVQAPSYEIKAENEQNLYTPKHDTDDHVSRISSPSPDCEVQFGIARKESIQRKRVNSLLPQLINIPPAAINGIRNARSRPHSVIALKDTVFRPRSRSLSPNTYSAGIVSRCNSRAISPTPHSRSRSRTRAMLQRIALGSPEKLSKFYDIHTGLFLNPGTSINVIKQNNAKLRPAAEHTGTLPDTEQSIILSTSTSQASNKADSTSNSPLQFTIPNNYSNALNEPKTTQPQPKPTDCEISNTHVCPPSTRYRCPFSQIQLDRMVRAVNELDEQRSAQVRRDDDSAVQRQIEQQGEWAKRWLEVMRARHDNGDGSESKQD